MKSIRALILVCAFLVYAPVLVAAESGSATGTVAEVIEAGGYVYLKLEEQGLWIAANTFAVSKGDTIQYSGGMEMNQFHSKSLDRTFESIYFVSQAGLAGDSSASKPAASMAAPAGTDMKIAKPEAVVAPVAGEVTPLKGGKTVADIYTDSSDLKDQVVSLRAKVIKVNQNIMGRHWITLQDGTGTDPDNKLLATSQDVVKPGDLVVVKGTVATEVDLGYGYNYTVLLEESTFTSATE